MGIMSFLRRKRDTWGYINVNRKYYFGRTELMLATQDGYVGTVEWLLNHGAEVDARDGCGWTALIWAANKGHAGIVKFLLGHGADMNAKNEDGRTAVDIAIKAGGGHARSVELFLLKKHAV